MAVNVFLYNDICCVPVAQWWSIALAAQKVVGSIEREHTKMYNLNALYVTLDKSIC